MAFAVGNVSGVWVGVDASVRRMRAFVLIGKEAAFVLNGTSFGDAANS